MATLFHPAIITSLSLAVAMIFFILGVLIGVMCTKCTTQFQRASRPAPQHHHDRALVQIYEEVPVQTVVGKDSNDLDCKIDDNVAYGPI